ncbi:hypothetical protein C8R44DRAFT_732100 [Mycena epipterygia]|nr:hypothetical protein C8R44DRAFT_732100 [Mycena epipterygia]
MPPADDSDESDLVSSVGCDSGKPRCLSDINNNLDNEAAVNCDICGASLAPDDLGKEHVFRCYNCETCGACGIQLAPAGVTLPIDTVMCDDCGPKLLCSRCCMTEHRRKPLHKIRVWEQGWQGSSLVEEGLVFQLGHGWQPCLWPIEPASSMTVIDMNGIHTVRLAYYRCGKFEPGTVGNWQQILDNGWYRAALVHLRVCATFRVLSADMELRYQS